MHEVYVVLSEKPASSDCLGVYENSTSAVAAVREWCENHEDDWFQSGSSYIFYNISLDMEWRIRIKEFEKNFLHIDAANL